MSPSSRIRTHYRSHLPSSIITTFIIEHQQLNISQAEHAPNSINPILWTTSTILSSPSNSFTAHILQTHHPPLILPRKSVRERGNNYRGLKTCNQTRAVVDPWQPTKSGEPGPVLVLQFEIEEEQRKRDFWSVWRGERSGLRPLCLAWDQKRLQPEGSLNSKSSKRRESARPVCLLFGVLCSRCCAAVWVKAEERLGQASGALKKKGGKGFGERLWTRPDAYP